MFIASRASFLKTVLLAGGLILTLAMGVRHGSGILPKRNLLSSISITRAVIGGMGTMYGAMCGATIFILGQSYLQDLMAIGANATQNVPMLLVLLSPDRWLLWLGVLFVLSVYYFPTGIVGKLRRWRR